jgi:hypothetical protein
MDHAGKLHGCLRRIFETRRTVTVNWEDVSRCTDPPAAMAPLKVASFDIECTSSHGDFPLPIKDYGKTAREIVIGSRIQCKNRAREQVLDDLEEKFISIFRDDVPSTDISKVFVKNKIDVTSESINSTSTLTSVTSWAPKLTPKDRTRRPTAQHGQ